MFSLFMRGVFTFDRWTDTFVFDIRFDLRKCARWRVFVDWTGLDRPLTGKGPANLLDRVEIPIGGVGGSVEIIEMLIIHLHN